MSVKQPGRPSVRSERRAQILTATAEVIASRGMAGATLSRIAATAGLQRTLVLHYFGGRDTLISEFINRAVVAYGSNALGLGKGEPIDRRVAALFDATAYRSHADLVVWLELVALAGRDEAVRDQLRDIWTKRWLPELEAELAAEIPTASPSAVADTCYAVLCLFEAHWAFVAQGVGDERRRGQAESAALALIDTLRPARQQADR